MTKCSRLQKDYGQSRPEAERLISYLTMILISFKDESEIQIQISLLLHARVQWKS